MCRNEVLWSCNVRPADHYAQNANNQLSSGLNRTVNKWIDGPPGGVKIVGEAGINTNKVVMRR